MELASSISTRLHYQHKSLLDIIEGQSDEQIRRQLVPGKWSIFENIVHVQTYQHTFVSRVNLILTTHNPIFPRYTAEADPMFLDNCSKSTWEIIQDMMTTRKDMSGVMQSFNVADLNKTGEHPVYGCMTLVQWINFFLLHEAHHLFTIFKLTGELRKEAR
ncbi:MAG: DinB family protein [Bacteroidota bacterium]|nr:DinB family protein [Bacteroidota bacterium]